MIHPTAIVRTAAKLDSTVSVGPYAVIDEDVELGAGCIVGPHVYLTGLTRIGVNNRFHAGCVIGDAPQDLKFKNEPTRLRIGDNNVFREHVTAHRSTNPNTETVIGSDNFFMANSHVGHNCAIGNRVILANGALLGGHAVVQDRVFISGNCLVHQFARIGALALMQGGSGISKDLPPFCVALHENEMCGLNAIGLRRAGFSTEQRLELKRLYHLLFRGGKNLGRALTEAHEKFTSDTAKILLDFIGEARRGVCADTGNALKSKNDE